MAEIVGKHIPQPSQPCASIILTCYNLGEFLDEALDSALQQTYPNIEVILVDDGSTDPATQEVVARAATHPRVQLLQLENGGVSRARNLGIAAARGEYILPLDADDRIHPEYVAKAVAVLAMHPEVGFVGCHYQTFGAHEIVYRPMSYSLAELLVENPIPIAAVMRRICWEQVGGYSSEIAIEDWDLWISIMERGYEAAVIPEVLFEYRVRPGSRHDLNQRPEAYEQTAALLYDRHVASYERYGREIMLNHLRSYNRLVESRNWFEQQSLNWQCIADERQAWITERERALDWQKMQATNWQSEAESSWLHVRELQAWIQSLEKTIDSNKKSIASNKAIYEEHRAWIQELEQVRNYHENQSKRWEQIAKQQRREFEQALQKGSPAFNRAGVWQRQAICNRYLIALGSRLMHRGVRVARRMGRDARHSLRTWIVWLGGKVDTLRK